MEQNPSWEANSSSACWEIPSTLWILKVHYHTHNIPPPVPVLIQINPNHVPSYFLNIHLILLYLLHLDLPSGLFPSGFPTKSHAPVPLHWQATFPPHSSRFDHAGTICWGVWIIMLIVTYSTPLPCPLNAKYLPQHLILKHPQPMIPLIVSLSFNITLIVSSFHTNNTHYTI